jgi:hypothetical protein
LDDEYAWDQDRGRARCAATKRNQRENGSKREKSSQSVEGHAPVLVKRPFSGVEAHS